MSDLPPLRRWWRSYSERDGWGQAGVVLEAVVLVGCVLVSAVMVVLGGLLADLLSAWLDPRQREA